MTSFMREAILRKLKELAIWDEGVDHLEVTLRRPPQLPLVRIIRRKGVGDD